MQGVIKLLQPLSMPEGAIILPIKLLIDYLMFSFNEVSITPNLNTIDSHLQYYSLVKNISSTQIITSHTTPINYLRKLTYSGEFSFCRHSKNPMNTSERLFVLTVFRQPISQSRRLAFNDAG